MKKILLLAVFLLTGCGEPDFSCSNSDALDQLKTNARESGKWSGVMGDIINEDYLEALEKVSIKFDNIIVLEIDPLTQRHLCSAIIYVENNSTEFQYLTFPVNGGKEIGVQFDRNTFSRIINQTVMSVAKMRHISDLKNTREAVKIHYERLDSENKKRKEAAKAFDEAFEKYTELFKSDEFNKKILPKKIEEYISNYYFNGQIEKGSNKIVDLYLEPTLEYIERMNSASAPQQTGAQISDEELVEIENQKRKKISDEFQKQKENELKNPYFANNLVDFIVRSDPNFDEDSFYCEKNTDSNIDEIQQKINSACANARNANNQFTEVFIEVLKRNNLTGMN